jgi:hypothetical protein
MLSANLFPCDYARHMLSECPQGSAWLSPINLDAYRMRLRRTQRSGIQHARATTPTIGATACIRKAEPQARRLLLPGIRPTPLPITCCMMGRFPGPGVFAIGCVKARDRVRS